MTQSIRDGHVPSLTVSKRFDFVELTPDGTLREAGPAPYLDYEPRIEGENTAITQAAGDPWLARGAEAVAVGWAIEHTLADHYTDVTARVSPLVAKAKDQVRQRLTSEINYWDARNAELLDREAAGRELKIRPETAYRRARDLERRLESRLADLEMDGRLTAEPPVLVGAALVLPQGLIDRLAGVRNSPAAQYARETAEVERRAVDAVLAAERVLGREPQEMSHNHPGYDVRSTPADGPVIRIEVKGRITGSADFVITRNEVLTAKNLGDDYRLALVDVSPGGPESDQVRYLTRPFDGTGTDDFRVTRFTLNWKRTWTEGGSPR
jgi:hypothetical protein